MRALHWLPTISLRALLNGAAAAHTFLESPLFVLRAPSSRAEVFLACHLANHSGTPQWDPPFCRLSHSAISKTTEFVYPLKCVGTYLFKDPNYGSLSLRPVDLLAPLCRS